MSNQSKKSEAEIYNLAANDDMHRQIAINKMLDRDGQRRTHSLVALMLDTYKQKVKSTLAKSIEEKCRIEYDRKLELERIKYSYDSLQHERDKIRCEDLVKKIKSEKDEVQKLFMFINELKNKKKELEILFRQEESSRKASDGEKNAFNQELRLLRNDFNSLEKQMLKLREENRVLKNQYDEVNRISEQKDTTIAELNAAIENARMHDSAMNNDQMEHMNRIQSLESEVKES